MNAEIRPNLTMQGAGTPDGAMIIRMVRYPRLQLYLLITSILLLELFLLFLFLSIVFNDMKDPGSLFLKNVFTPALFIGGITSGALALIMRKKLYVKPLGYRGYKDFILADEGIYTRIRTGVTKSVYKFYPWNAVKVYHVNDNRKVLGLKSWLSLIKLSDKRDFDGLKNIVFSKVPSPVPMVSKVPLFHPGRFFAAFILCFFLWAVVGTNYSNIYNNPPDDDRCDVCGTKPTFYGNLFYYQQTMNDGTTKYIHEYCDFHDLIQWILKPWEFLALKGPVKDHYSGNLALVVFLIPWYIILLLLSYLSIPKWYKTLRYT